jgi:hypothetical protein
MHTYAIIAKYKEQIMTTTKASQRLSSFWLATGAVLLIFMSISTARAQIKDIDDAVYKAARQGMLVERMAKSYMALTMKVEETTAKRVLNESASQFDRHLIELKVFSPTAEVKAVYGQIGDPWVKFKELVLGVQPSAESARRIEELEGSLLQLTNSASQLLQKQSKAASTQLVLMAENDAMYSQRVARLHLASLATGVPPKSSEMNKLRDDFMRNLATIKGSRTTPAAVARKIELAESQWAFLDKAVSNRADERNRKSLSSNVFKASERVLEIIEDVAVSLERL